MSQTAAKPGDARVSGEESSTWRRLIASCGRAVFNLVYPPVCPLCRRTATGCSLTPTFCRGCIEALTPAPEPQCQICAAPVGPYLDTSSGCVRCSRESFRFESVIRLGVYDDELRTACLTAKEPGSQAMAAALGELIWQERAEELTNVDCDAVVAVPQHWRRRWRKDHNAAETLARHLARRLQAAFVNRAVVKTRWTPRQSTLSPTARRTNLRGAFKARRVRAVRGRTVLLVDDILTTGATANEVSRTLRKAGAERVYVAVVARGLGR